MLRESPQGALLYFLSPQKRRNEARGAGVDGLIVPRAGRSKDWVKVKNRKHAAFIGGCRIGSGALPFGPTRALRRGALRDRQLVGLDRRLFQHHRRRLAPSALR